MTQTNEPGRKDDSGKPRWSLMPFKELSEMLLVLEYGASKYGANDWTNVAGFRDRYFNAAMRHFMAWWSGERNDPESGHGHLAHAACCLVFLMWNDNNCGTQESGGNDMSNAWRNSK